MVNMEKLTAAGMDLTSLRKRLMGNDALIKLFVNKFLADGNYEALAGAFARKDMKAAEIASHTLKGMCGNMSLDVLYGLFSEQTNLIRCGEYEKAEAMMADIAKAFDQAATHMGAWLADN